MQADASPIVQRTVALQRAADARTVPAQRVEEEDLPQGKAIQRVEEEDLLQGKMIQRKLGGEAKGAGEQKMGGGGSGAEAKGGEDPNRLPRDLRTGMEHIAQMSLDDVRVHRNSGAPAQVGAHAYAQGRDIHLGPGQEKHLPHEAWHVVQQAQGRVRPTMQAKGVAINDDPGMEAEADRMGAAAQLVRFLSAGAQGAAVQRVEAPSDVKGRLPRCIWTGMQHVAQMSLDELRMQRKQRVLQPVGANMEVEDIGFTPEPILLKAQKLAGNSFDHLPIGPPIQRQITLRNGPSTLGETPTVKQIIETIHPLIRVEELSASTRGYIADVLDEFDEDDRIFQSLDELMGMLDGEMQQEEDDLGSIYKESTGEETALPEPVSLGRVAALPTMNIDGNVAGLTGANSDAIRAAAADMSNFPVSDVAGRQPEAKRTIAMFQYMATHAESLSQIINHYLGTLGFEEFDKKNEYLVKVSSTMMKNLTGKALWIGPERLDIILGNLDATTYFKTGHTLLLQKAAQAIAADKSLVSLLSNHSTNIDAKSYGRRQESMGNIAIGSLRTPVQLDAVEQEAVRKAIINFPDENTLVSHDRGDTSYLSMGWDDVEPSDLVKDETYRILLSDGRMKKCVVTNQSAAGVIFSFDVD